MINFLLAPACYFLVIEITRLWGIFEETNKVLLIFISILIYGCLLNFVNEPPNLIACGGLMSWLAIIITEIFIYIEDKKRKWNS